MEPFFRTEYWNRPPPPQTRGCRLFALPRKKNFDGTRTTADAVVVGGTVRDDPIGAVNVALADELNVLVKLAVAV